MPPPSQDPYSARAPLLDADGLEADVAGDELEANAGIPATSSDREISRPPSPPDLFSLLDAGHPHTTNTMRRYNPYFYKRRSHYVLTKNEIARGIANRFVHSRTYIFLYLGMACLSATTVGLSLAEGCPGPAFYILEIIVNSAMILEVGIRFVAFGKQFWKSPFNVVDLILTLFCAVTLLVLAFAECGSTSKEEELLDTLLLVARNVLQFARLAAVMRQSGQSIFARPKPIDLTLPHRSGPNGSYGLDIDLEDDEEADVRPLGRPQVVFDAEQRARDQERRMQQQRRAAAQAAVRPVDSGDQTDTWASLG